MKRQNKYPDTEVFKYYNANPKGKIGDDCVIRAISTALEQSWDQTVIELTELGLKLGYVLNDQKCYEKYLKEKGFVKMKQPRKIDNTKYTGIEFCKNKIAKDCIANIGAGHIVAIKEYKVHDIWNSTRNCIGNYWVKQEK